MSLMVILRQIEAENNSTRYGLGLYIITFILYSITFRGLPEVVGEDGSMAVAGLDSSVKNWLF